ncbi:MAG: rubrerythrin family protein [Planctomycetota bacterium]|jgi:rubrerythrin
MSTQENLQNAFAGESKANRKYLAFARQADKDGFAQVARLFRAAAEAETIHAHAHLRAMGVVKSTAENLQAAVDGETFEFKNMYPPYVEEAQAEGQNAAAASFRNALAVEQIHAALYDEALSKVKAGQDMEAAKVMVCPVCGNTVLGDAPDKCPVCGVSGDKFFEVE